MFIVYLTISRITFTYTYNRIRSAKFVLCKGYIYIYIYTGYSQKNGAVSKVNKKSISHLILVKRTPSAAVTVCVSHALPAVRTV
jgi:hypothetical protein